MTKAELKAQETTRLRDKLTESLTNNKENKARETADQLARLTGEKVSDILTDLALPIQVGFPPSLSLHPSFHLTRATSQNKTTKPKGSRQMPSHPAPPKTTSSSRLNPATKPFIPTQPAAMNPKPRKGATPYNREGAIVGGSAPALSTSSKGHKMLEKMGWTAGSGLGREGGEMGRLDPVEVVVKTSRMGVGMMQNGDAPLVGNGSWEDAGIGGADAGAGSWGWDDGVKSADGDGGVGWMTAEEWKQLWSGANGL